MPRSRNLNVSKHHSCCELVVALTRDHLKFYALFLILFAIAPRSLIRLPLIPVRPQPLATPIRKMSSPGDLSLAEDSQDEVLSEANDASPQNEEDGDNMGDLFGDEESDQDARPSVLFA